jgi:hypothetical protein
MKSGVDIILSKLSKLELPYDIIFEIEKHVYHWIHSHKQPKIHKEILYSLYKKEFPDSTPVTVACEKGRLEHLKIFVAGYNDVKESGMTLKEYVNQEGTTSRDYRYTPLMMAAMNEHFQIVKYLIEQCEADSNIADSIGWNALHWAAYNNKKDTKLIQCLLNHMSLNSINKKTSGWNTPLDYAYENNSPIKQKIIDLIRSKGGKANWHDANGRNVGRGNGDLND